MPDKLLSKDGKLKVTLKGGGQVQLRFRPYVLRDKAWMQKEFPTEEDQLAIAGLMIDPIAKIVWNSLDIESQKAFAQVTFIGLNKETAEEEEIKVFGYEKLIYGLENEDQLMALFVLYGQMKEENDFAPNDKKKVKT